MGTGGYLGALNRLRQVANDAGKKTYTLLVGKPSPAKLANFPEVEVFVMLSDPQGLILDSKEYYAPVVTPFEAYLAFTDRPWPPGGVGYRLDFGFLWEDEAPAAPAAAGDVSAGAGATGAAGRSHSGLGIGGNVREDGSDDEEGVSAAESTSGDSFSNSRALAVGSAAANASLLALAATTAAAGKTIVPKTAAEFMALKRTYQGLEAPITGAERKAPEIAQEGRLGRAAGYVDEPSRS